MNGSMNRTEQNRMKNKSDKTRPVYAPKKFGHLDDPRGSYLEFLRMCNHGSTKAEAYASFGIPWTPKKEEKAPEDSRAKQRARYHEKKAAQGIPSKEFGPLADRRKQTPEEKREKQRERDARRKPKAEKRAYRIMQYTEDERARIAAGATPEERDCIRSRIYYARNKETIAIKRKEWSKKHAEGWIDEGMPEGKFVGAYGQMARGVNELVRSQIAVKMRIVEVVSRYAIGDFSLD